MSDKQSNLTDKEMEDLQNIVANTLASICVMADRHNIDRDSMLKYFADMLTVFTEVVNIQNYETNHANANRIRNMSDEELADTLFNSCLEVMHIDECPYADNVGECKKCLLDWLQSEAE
nr:MAG TPA: hypothetical protein [Caudoviricetes sp.]